MFVSGISHPDKIRIKDEIKNSAQECQLHIGQLLHMFLIGLTLSVQSFTFGGAVSRFALPGPRRGVLPFHG